jgi:hypothetical protein
MKIQFIGTITRQESGEWLFPRVKPKRGESSHIPLSSEVGLELVEKADREPLVIHAASGTVLYRRHVVQVSHVRGLSLDEILLHVKHKVLSRERAFRKMQQEVDAFENFERLSSVPREPVAAAVRMFVWQRDGGKCVRCGSQERLEFDHIIPVVKGGSSTERNIQLLCETCNRSKGIEV